MKRKFFGTVALLLALVMAMPTGVLAAVGGGSETNAVVTEGISIEADKTQIYAGGVSNTAVLTLKGIPADATDLSVSWSASPAENVSLSGSGSVCTVEAVSAGECIISALYSYRTSDGTLVGSAVNTNINVIAYQVQTISAEVKAGKAFNVGDPIDKENDLIVTVTSNENPLPTTTKNFTISPTTVPADKKITVTAGGKSCDVILPVADYDPKDHVASIKITYPTSTTEFKVDDKLKTDDIIIEVTDDAGKKSMIYYKDYTADIKLTGLDFSGGAYIFKTTDVGKKSITAEYAGKTNTVEFTVKAKETKPYVKNYTVLMSTGPSKKTYKVGDNFEPAGMNITITYYDEKNVKQTVPKTSVEKATFTSYKITSEDYKNKDNTGKHYITIPITIKLKDEAAFETQVRVTGLTITEKATTLDIYSIVDFELKNEKYPIGYEFSASDVSRFRYKEARNGSTKTLYASQFELYTNCDDMEVLVLDEDGDTKRKKSSEIEEEDVLKDSKSREYVKIRLVVLDEDDDEVEGDGSVYVGESGVRYYYDGRKSGDLVATYDDIFDALEYTVDQDDDIDTKDFDLDDVDDDEELILVLGEDQEKKTDSFYRNNRVDLCHNVVIDLNGHSLTFPTDFINITKSNKKYTLKITNTSSKAGTFSYSDEDVTLTLNEDDEIEFEYDEDVPGIYTVTVSAGTGGTVKSTPSADRDDEIKVGMGSEIKFTITPSTGYSLDTIKADGKTVATTAYTTSASGVVTYTLKNVTKDQKVEVTFKKSETKPAVQEWKNPFNDVSKNDAYYSAVQFVYEHELFRGVSDTRFSPDATMTRAMFVTVLGRLAGADVARYKTSSYSDVPLNSTTSWYAPYVEWATQNGIIEGYGDGKFGPDNKITHQQMYVMMLRYTKFVENISVNASGVTINASDSFDVADWASEACKFASQKNFLVKNGSRIDPTGEAKRSELAQLLEKYCDTVLEWNKSGNPDR